MPTPTLIPGNQQQDDEHNIGQKKTDDLLNRLSNGERRPGTIDMGGFEDQFKAPSYDGPTDPTKRISERESEVNKPAGWKYDDSNATHKPKKTPGKLLGLAINNKGKLGIIGGTTGALIGLFMFLGSVLSLPSLGNMLMQNDPSSREIQARTLKVLSNATNNDDPACTGVGVKTFGCKTKRISYSALSDLETKAGITAYDASGKKIELKKTGYPEKNPASYKVVLDGTTKDLSKSELGSFIENNTKVKAKVIGVGGIFNPNWRAWASKYLNEKLLKPAGISKRGGITDGESKKLSPEERKNTFTERLKKAIPGFDKLGGNSETLASRISSATGAKVEKQLNRAKKGGVGYLAGVSTCVGVKAPMYFAAGYAAVQIAQVLPVISEVILSPSSKAMASGVDKQAKFTADDNELVMSTLTDKYPDKNGKMSSALDSEILQSATGSNTGRPAVSEKFAPGFAAITSPIVIGSMSATAAMAPYCNALMSPASMYSAMAVDAATSVLASATVVGGIAKVVGSWVISEIAVKAGSAIAGAAASALITQMATNADIPLAKGRDLGDLLGTSAYVLKSSAGAARHLGVLKESDIVAVNKDNSRLEAETRDMDIASLSPFDTSSRYTFLGSIASQFSSSIILNDGYSNIFSKLLAVARTPLMGTPAGAAPVQSYASEFGLNTNDANSPCITVAGTPCYGLTPEQRSISTDTAISALYNEGWIDDSKPISKDNATISDLVSSGQIKADTPLNDFISNCSDLMTGDYLINSASCTTASSTKNPADTTGLQDGGCLTGSDKKQTCPSDLVGDSTVEGLKSGKSLVAMAPALLDYQIAQSFNGFDDPNQDQSTTSGLSGNYVFPVDLGYRTPDQDTDWGDRDICIGSANSYCKFHRGVDFTFGGEGQPVYAVADGEVVETALGNPGCARSTSGQISMDNRVLIRHADGTTTGYSHMPVSAIQAAGISVGTKVKAGQKIGEIGDCGNSQGAHLHFSVNPGDATDPKITSIASNNNGETYIDPAAYMLLYGVDIMGKRYTDGR